MIDRVQAEKAVLDIIGLHYLDIVNKNDRIQIRKLENLPFKVNIPKELPCYLPSEAGWKKLLEQRTNHNSSLSTSSLPSLLFKSLWK